MRHLLLLSSKDVQVGFLRRLGPYSLVTGWHPAGCQLSPKGQPDPRRAVPCGCQLCPRKARLTLNQSQPSDDPQAELLRRRVPVPGK